MVKIKVCPNCDLKYTCNCNNPNKMYHLETVTYLICDKFFNIDAFICSQLMRTFQDNQWYKED